MTLSDLDAGRAASPGAERSISRRRLHPLSPVLDLVVIGWRMWPVLVVSALNDLRFVLFVPVIAAILGWRYIAWRRSSWEVGGGVLRVEKGVVQRSTRLIPADRVQQVEIVRKLRHQLFGVASVRIDLAGGSDPSAVLDVVSLEEAALLQRTLDAHRRADVAMTPGAPLPPPTPPAQVLVTLGPRLLALGGMTGFAVLVVPAALFAALDVLADLRLAPEAPDDPVRVAGLAWVALIVVVATVWVAVGALVGIVQHHGFTMERRSADELAIRRGLFERRTSVVPLRRVQRIEVHANPARRAFRLVRVQVATAAAHRDDDGPGDQHPGVPVLRRADLPEVLEAFLPGAGAPPAWRSHPSAARRRAVIRRIRWLLVLVGVVALLSRSLVVVAVGPVLAVAIAVPWGIVWHRRLGHDVVGPLLHVRAGVVALQRTVVLLSKVQSVRVTSSPLQRRAGLVDVHVDLPGSSAVVQELGRHEADALVAVLRSHAGG